MGEWSGLCAVDLSFCEAFVERGHALELAGALVAGSCLVSAEICSNL